MSGTGFVILTGAPGGSTFLADLGDNGYVIDASVGSVTLEFPAPSSVTGAGWFVKVSKRNLLASVNIFILGLSISIPLLADPNVKFYISNGTEYL